MRHTSLGRTGLPVSRLCLGTMTFGVQCDEEQSFAIMDTAFEAGITFFDTADVYANTKAESVLGEALKGERRESLEIFTKVYWPTGPGANDRGLSRKHITESCNASLQRLQTDFIDLLCYTLGSGK